jgi:hypothetical protein
MSNNLINKYYESGAPCGENADFASMGDWAGVRISELEEVAADWSKKYFDKCRELTKAEAEVERLREEFRRLRSWATWFTPERGEQEILDRITNQCTKILGGE